MEDMFGMGNYNAGPEGSDSPSLPDGEDAHDNPCDVPDAEIEAVLDDRAVEMMMLKVMGVEPPQEQ